MVSPSLRQSRIAAAALLLLSANMVLPQRATGASVSAADAAQLAETIAAVRSITTLRADFEQIDTNGQRVTGVFTLKQPKKFRFAYQPGYPLLVVSDGRALAMIDYEVRQVQRFPLRFTPVGALLDPGRNVSHIAHIEPTGDPNVIAVLIRDHGLRQTGEMTISFQRNWAAPGGLEIAGWAMVDTQNRRTIVRLSHQQYGVEVTDDVFTWRDPRPPGHR